MDLTFDPASPWGYVLVLLAAATPMLEVLVVIPAAIIAGLAPLPVVVLALAGNVATVALAVLAGDRIVVRLQARRARRAGERGPAAEAAERAVTVEAADEQGPSRGRSGRAARLVQRWGIPGLALVAPALTGSHVAAVAALALGGDRRRVLVWLTIGLVAWAVPVGILAAVGVDLMGRA